MDRFLFIRHGKTKSNIEKRYLGRTDEPLYETVSFDTGIINEDYSLFVSPMLRCRQTASSIFPGKRQIIIDDLRECDFGIFEGKTAGELSENPNYAAWLDTGCNGDVPGGDSVSGFKERCCRAFLHIAETDGALAVVVTHGGVIMAILERFGYPKREFYEYMLKNCGYFLREYRDGVLIL